MYSYALWSKTLKETEVIKPIKKNPREIKREIREKIKTLTQVIPFLLLLATLCLLVLSYGFTKWGWPPSIAIGAVLDGVAMCNIGACIDFVLMAFAFVFGFFSICFLFGTVPDLLDAKIELKRINKPASS